MSLQEKIQYHCCREDRIDIIYKDLPRLASKTNVYGIEGIIVRQDALTLDQRQQMNWMKLCNVVGAVVKELEDAEVHRDVVETLEESQRLLEDQPNQDKSKLFQSIFEPRLIHSRTRRLFQAVNQMVIVACIPDLRARVGMFKDHRARDAWKIDIEVLPSGRISVSHTRKEESIAGPEDPEHYTFCWEVCISFDTQIQFQAAIVKIVDYECHPLMSRESRDMRSRMFGGGNLIIKAKQT